MTTTAPRLGLAALACAAALAFAAPSRAEILHFKVSADSAQEVPPVDGKGTATVKVTYDTDTKLFTWDGTYSNLSGPPYAAHFHLGTPKDNGAIVIPLFGAKDNQSPFKGSVQLTVDQLKHLTAGKLYLQIHTDAHRGGEVRGQLTKAE
jgi:hypothetical protein